MISVIGATLKKLRDDAYDASLSRDGSQIVFRDSVTRDIWLMSADGGQAKVLIKREEGYHLFAPYLVSRTAIGSPYAKFRITNGETTLALESRDLKGGDPVVLLSNPRLTDFTWGQSGRLIYSVRELPPNQYDSNLWEMRYDEDTGKPKGNSAASHRLDRFLLWQSAIDRRWKTLRLPERQIAKRCLHR